MDSILFLITLFYNASALRQSFLQIYPTVLLHRIRSEQNFPVLAEMMYLPADKQVSSVLDDRIYLTDNIILYSSYLF